MSDDLLLSLPLVSPSESTITYSTLLTSYTEDEDNQLLIDSLDVSIPTFIEESSTKFCSKCGAQMDEQQISDTIMYSCTECGIVSDPIAVTDDKKHAQNLNTKFRITGMCSSGLQKIANDISRDVGKSDIKALALAEVQSTYATYVAAGNAISFKLTDEILTQCADTYVDNLICHPKSIENKKKTVAACLIYTLDKMNLFFDEDDILSMFNLEIKEIEVGFKRLKIAHTDYLKLDIYKVVQRLAKHITLTKDVKYDIIQRVYRIIDEVLDVCDSSSMSITRVIATLWLLFGGGEKFKALAPDMTIKQFKEYTKIRDSTFSKIYKEAIEDMPEAARTRANFIILSDHIEPAFPLIM